MMNKTNVLMVFLLAIFSASLAHSAEHEAELADAWMAGKANVYFQVQNELLDSESTVEDLAKSLRDDFDYDRETWARLVVAEATLLKLKNALEVQRLYGLQGLLSENYLKWRRPEPAVLRELKRMPNLTASMMELYHVGFSSYPWSGPAYEESERLALQMGLLHAIGESNHPARVFFLADIVESRFSSRAVRLSAVSALAKTSEGEALQVLSGLMTESQNDEELRAWIAGSIGHIRVVGSWNLIEEFLVDPSKKVQSAALGSVRLLLSRWHWDGRDAELARLQKQATPALVSLLEAESMDSKHSSIGETLSLVGGPMVLESLRTRVNDKSLTVQVRSRIQSALTLVERAERRRH